MGKSWIFRKGEKNAAVGIERGWMLFSFAKLAVKNRRATYEGTKEETVIALVLLSQGGI